MAINVKTHSIEDFKELPKGDFLIGIHSNGWKHSIPVLAKSNNVLNVWFEDVEKTGLKLIPWFNNDQRIIYAVACSDDQAKEIQRTILPP